MRRNEEMKRRERTVNDAEFLNRDVMSVREWMVTMILAMIPLFNLVFLAKWASADREQTPANKVNWARGSLVAMGAVILSVFLVIGLYLLGETIYLGWDIINF